MLTLAHPVPSLAVIHPKRGWNKKKSSNVRNKYFFSFFLLSKKEKKEEKNEKVFLRRRLNQLNPEGREWRKNKKQKLTYLTDG